MKPCTNNVDNADNGRLKLWEAAAAASLITALAASVAVTFTMLTARCFVMGAVDRCRRKAKGGKP